METNPRGWIRELRMVLGHVNDVCINPTDVLCPPNKRTIPLSIAPTHLLVPGTWYHYFVIMEDNDDDSNKTTTTATTLSPFPVVTTAATAKTPTSAAVTTPATASTSNSSNNDNSNNSSSKKTHRKVLTVQRKAEHIHDHKREIITRSILSFHWC